jgi:tRNA dimethylallyltransferase
MTDKLIAIVGPTATGKTALGVKLAHTLGGDIVSADSRQVYRHMEIGTAKPTAEERALVRHRLVDVVDPDEPFSLGQYLDLAGAALADVWSTGAPAFLVGGSGQYVWAILEGWQVPRVPPDDELRRRLEQRASREGPEALHGELAELEPEAAARIDSRNVRRVVRALEVRYRTGRPLSACRARTPPACDVLIIGLDCPRAELHRRIDARVDAMMKAGLVAEVEGLLARGYNCDLPAMSGIGYRQVCQHLVGEMTLDEAAAKIKTETHRLARMQDNWFRHDDPRIRWLSAGDGVYEEALRLAKDFVLAPAPRSR